MSRFVRGMTGCAAVSLVLASLASISALAEEAEFARLDAWRPKLQRMSAHMVEVQVLPETREVVITSEERITTNGQAVQRHSRSRVWMADDGTSSFLMPHEPNLEPWLADVKKRLDEKSRVRVQYWDGIRHSSFTPSPGEPRVWRGIRLARPLRPFISRPFLEGSYEMFGHPVPSAVARMKSVALEASWGQRVLVLSVRNPRSKPDSKVLLFDGKNRDMPCGLFLSDLPSAEAVELVERAESPDELRSGLAADISYEVEEWMEVDGVLLPRRVRQRSLKHRFKRGGSEGRLDRIWFVREITFHEGATWGPLPPMVVGCEAHVLDELLNTRTKYHADGTEEKIERRSGVPPASKDQTPPGGSRPVSNWRSWRALFGALAGVLLAGALLLGAQAWIAYRRHRRRRQPLSPGT